MSLEMNKIAGAVLVGGLVTLVSGLLADMLVRPTEVAHVAMAVPEAPAEGPGEAPAPRVVEPVLGLLASADTAAGEAISKRCTTCHTFEAGGPAKVGPNLFGIVGAPHAHMEGFAYSPAMQALHDQPWTYEALNHFLENPKGAVPGTKMVFPGLKKVQDRADLIAWLRTLADTPAPLPTQAEIDAATAAAQGEAAPAEEAAVHATATDATEPAPETQPEEADAAAAEQPAAEAEPAESPAAEAEAAPAETPEAQPAEEGAEDAAETPAPEPETTGAAEDAAPEQVAAVDSAEQPAAAETGEAQTGSSGIGALIAAADPAAGEKIAKRCTACHTFTADGANKVGPNLWNIVGAPHAHAEGFAYSEAMRSRHDQPWTYEALDAYLASPKDAIPGNKMAFAGLKKAEDRAALIAYLRTLSDSPQPLP